MRLQTVKLWSRVYETRCTDDSVQRENALQRCTYDRASKLFFGIPWGRNGTALCEWLCHEDEKKSLQRCVNEPYRAVYSAEWMITWWRGVVIGPYERFCSVKMTLYSTVWMIPGWRGVVTGLHERFAPWNEPIQRCVNDYSMKKSCHRAVWEVCTLKMNLISAVWMITGWRGLVTGLYRRFAPWRWAWTALCEWLFDNPALVQYVRYDCSV